MHPTTTITDNFWQVCLAVKMTITHNILNAPKDLITSTALMTSNARAVKKVPSVSSLPSVPNVSRLKDTDNGYSGIYPEC